MAATTEPAAGIRQLSCQVNGEQVQLDLPNDVDLTLLDVLRDFLAITSPKNGCQPQAQCPALPIPNSALRARNHPKWSVSVMISHTQALSILSH